MKSKGIFKNWRTKIGSIDKVEMDPFMESLFIKLANKKLPDYIQAISPQYTKAIIDLNEIAIKHRLKIVGSEHLREILNQNGWKNGLVLTSGNEDEPVIITNDTFDRAVLLAPQIWEDHPKLAENEDRRKKIAKSYRIDIERIKKEEMYKFTA